ncbi:hypothetical protein ACU4GD_45950 [Cupriavidus basilensis]
MPTCAFADTGADFSGAASPAIEGGIGLRTLTSEPELTLQALRAGWSADQDPGLPGRRGGARAATLITAIREADTKPGVHCRQDGVEGDLIPAIRSVSPTGGLGRIDHRGRYRGVSGGTTTRHRVLS